MIRRLLAALLLAAAACSPVTGAEPALLVEEARIVWRDPDPAHGGVSAIEVAEGGASALTMGDRGTFAAVALIRDALGRLTEARTTARAPVRDTEGRPARGRIADGEGLAIRPDGRIFASLEGPSRVWTWRDIATEAAWMPRDPGFRNLSVNKGLEALAIDEQGRLWTTSETPGGPLWVHDGEWRVAGALPRRGAFRVTGADFGPDGALWLLERRLGGFGFATRIRRLTLDGTRVAADETVLTSAPGLYGNLEGLSVWRGADGAIRATAVSDDNFLPVFETEIVEWRLSD